MEEREKKQQSGKISRREFLKDAGLIVGGTAIGSSVLLAACGSGETATETVTQTATQTKTVTTTEQVGTATKTVTQAVSKFVCPFCSSEFASLSALTAHVDAEHAAGTAALNVVTFTVNGQETTVQVEPNESLHELLHEKLGWTGIKDMCYGYGACGSCTTIVDGRPVLSCLTLAIECDGAVIETPEGAAKTNPALLDAYVVNACMQCGFCTPGFFVTAKALLDHTPKPTEDEIREALGGNICR